MEAVINFIKETLPVLSQDELVGIEAHIRDLGVESMDYMAELKEEDLVPPMKLIQARRLITHVKSSLQAVQDTPSTPSNPGTPSTPVTAPRIPPGTPSTPVITAGITPRTPSTPVNAQGIPGTYPDTPTVPQQHWAKSFKLPQSLFSSKVLKAIENRQPIASSDKRIFMGKVCDEIAKVTRLPGRPALRDIAQSIVRKHPDTFADWMPCGTELLGNGYQSLFQGLENYMNNHYSRGYSDGKRTKSDSPGIGKPAKRRLVDSYGCQNWEPSATASEESVKEVQDWLRNEMTKPKDLRNHSRVEEALKTFFPTMRQVINASENLATLKQDWPALFNMRYMGIHFHSLMGFGVEKLDDDLPTKSKGLVSVAREKALSNKKKSQPVPQSDSVETLSSILSWFDNEALKGNGFWAATQTVLPLLVLLVGEKLEHIIKLYPKMTSLDEVDLTQEKPYIAIIGDNIWEATYHIVAEGTTVVTYLGSLSESLKAVFMTHYCFNIPYPEETTATFEFIQRCMAKVNPEKGSKVTQKKGRSSKAAGHIHPKVTALSKKLLTAILM